MNITKETISKLNQLGYNVWAHDDNCNEVPFEKGNYIYIDYRSVKAPKQKEVTVEWLLDKISENRLIETYPIIYASYSVLPCLFILHHMALE